ncbi:caspase-7 isoform X2 [Paramormyrops kingsleyae]|uniref:caspase-7 isoform X2 n=1 Tax=Paramormyrops kingsleyae TaxID=1676925 RepID=UPI003B96FA9E
MLDAGDFISISTMFSCLKEIPRGNRAILVSVTDFYPGVQLAKRRGAKRDTKRLHKILYKLGFQVDVYEDLSAEETYEVFEAASRESVEDCFVGVISSHGEEGLVFGVDGKAVKLAQIFSLFSNPAMDGKTKLFFVQACRGVDLDPGVETDSAEDDKEDSFSHLLSIPVDSAVVFATSPGYSAFMHPLGSVFLQTLCDLLEMEGGQDLEVTQLLTRLNYRVAYGFEARGPQLAGKKEMPCFVSRLTRQAFPFSLRETGLWGVHQYLPDEPADEARRASIR